MTISAPSITSRGRVPPRALALSLAALAVPVAHGFAAGDGSPQYEFLVGMTPLVPALVLSYYRGWRGAAVALAGGMATLALAQVMAVSLGNSGASWPLIWTSVAIFIALTLGIGFVSEMLHRAREDAERLAFTDELTALPNRRYARMILEREFAAAERGRQLALVLFDVDHFKAFNDTHGHAAGDEALQALALALEAATRKMDLSARYGGDEFLSVISSSDAQGALAFIERVRQQLRRVGDGRLTVSAGIAAYDRSMRLSDDLLAAADAALYRAKKEGRDCVHEAAPPQDSGIA